MLADHLGDARVVPLEDNRKPRSERARGIYGSHPAGDRLDVLKSHLDGTREGRSFERPEFCSVRGAAFESEPLPLRPSTKLT